VKLEAYGWQEIVSCAFNLLSSSIRTSLKNAENTTVHAMTPTLITAKKLI